MYANKKQNNVELRNSHKSENINYQYAFKGVNLENQYSVQPGNLVETSENQETVCTLSNQVLSDTRTFCNEYHPLFNSRGITLSCTCILNSTF